MVSEKLDENAKALAERIGNLKVKIDKELVPRENGTERIKMSLKKRLVLMNICIIVGFVCLTVFSIFYFWNTSGIQYQELLEAVMRDDDQEYSMQGYMHAYWEEELAFLKQKISKEEEKKTNSYLLNLENTLQETVKHFAILLVSIVVIDILLLIFWNYFFMNQLVLKSIYTLGRCAEAIGYGDLKHSIPFDRNDEIGRLEKSFEKMRQMLQKAEQERKQTEEYTIQFSKKQI